LEEAIKWFEGALEVESSEYDLYASTALDESRAMMLCSMSPDDWCETSREARAHATAIVIEERRINYYFGLLNEYKILSKQGKL
jgi:hypothetical protein